jgi:MoxR-like ATPase
VNAALFGPAGNGKSTACKGSAAAMGMPFDIYSCDPDTTLESMFGGTRVNINKQKADDPDFVFVEGVVAKALRCGHFLEIQEVGLVRRPGVMAALNAIMEAGPGKYLTLETGQRIYRDPKAIVVFTSNDGYHGTQLFNQSVLSRNALVKYFENPTAEEMTTRALAAVPDFVDADTLTRMAKTVMDLSAYLRDNEIDTGVCGQRELTNWAMAVMYELFVSGESLSNKLVRRAAQSTLVEKTSQHREEIEEAADAVVNRDWGCLEF